MIPIAETLLDWYACHGRHDLPWRQNRDPYQLWLAEIMLQQTQVESAKPYYARFLQALPNWQVLAAAPQDRVLALWSGLGYYARARNAQRAAQEVVTRFGGHFPNTLEAAVTLPGVGRSTAAAVLASAYGQRQAILDANARRVLIRSHAIEGDPKVSATQQWLWTLASALTPEDAHGYNQAIQDLGALICTPRQPRCTACPLVNRCLAHAQGRSHALPVTVNKAPKPQRCAFFLLVVDTEGQILLEKRPDSGIWGGLWCLPQAAPDGGAFPILCSDTLHPLEDTPAVRQSLQAAWSRRLGLNLQLKALEEAQQHVFTHFQLRFRCVHARVLGSAVADSAANLRWYRRADALTQGLPTPIRRILRDRSGGC
ncbi:MAG: A/G-specific adenine glycosylase [Acidithiobacillus ferrivorans]